MNSERNERWQTKITCLKQAVTKIYETKEFSDVTFVVKGNVIFRGHRLILASRSAEFARILLCSNAVEQIIVDNEMVTETGFDILLRFIYKDVIGTTDKRSIIEAYIAAQHFKQTTLIAKCEDIIRSWIIDVNEVFELLDAGSDVPVLKQKCLHFIRSNAAKVLSSPSFLNTSLKTLCTILQNDCLHHISPIERINSVMKWSKNRHPDEKDYSEVRKELLDCELSPLSKLGFETLELNDLNFVVNNYVNLLNPSEVMNFMMYYSSRNEALLPEWCTPAVKKEGV